MTHVSIRLSRILPLLPGLALVAALAFSAPASATSIEPDFVSGNPTCASLGYDFSFKIDPPNAGTYSIDGLHTVTVTTDGVNFDWSSDLEIDAVISKGGPNANIYGYEPPAEATSDTELHSPVNPSNGTFYDLSHIDFCFDYEVKITNEIQTSFTRMYQWDLDKSVAPELWTLFSGDSGTSLYTIAAERTGFMDSDWAAAGTITIHNPSPLTATLTAVTDAFSPEIAAEVDCGVSFPYSLAGDGTLECTYQAALPDGASRVSTAAVTTTGAVESGAGSAAAEFAVPTTEVNASIEVADSNGGSWTFNGSGAVSYPRTFSCDSDQGVHGNGATILQTGQTASASVAVQCYGLEVYQDAHTFFTRTWDWSITKSADQTELTLTPGQQFLVQYEVAVSAAATDSDWLARGTITVNNPNPLRGAVLQSVTDLAGATGGSVDCGIGLPYLLGPGGSLACSYESDLPSMGIRTSTATATLQNFSFAPDGTGLPASTTDFSADTVSGLFGDTISDVGECADVTDSLQGTLGTVCEDAAPGVFHYSRYAEPFTAPDQCGLQEVKNTASFIAGETGATGESSSTVRVNVACDQGCTLTPGYWKTHSRKGPAPYDDTWAELGPAQEATPFFKSGKS
jgi:hypothetical protein